MARAQLVLIEPSLASEGVPLRARRIRLGRSRDCDLVFDLERISRHHARLSRVAGGGYALEDLGSLSGTYVNGDRLTGLRPLMDGDEIALSDGDVRLRYEILEADPNARRILGAVLAVSTCVALGFFAWWLFGRTDPAIRQAQALADSAVAASKRGEWATSQRELRSAAGLLYQAQLLDDTETDHPVRSALEQLGKDRDQDLWAILEQSQKELRPRAATVAATPKQRRCRVDEASAERIPRCLRLEVDFVLGELGEDANSVPDRWLPHIGGQLARQHGFFSAILARENEVVPLLKQELGAAEMPEFFHYLALIESAYRTDAKSHAGAVGVWQFIPATARRYDLEVNDRIDERRDPARATRAAAAYLRDLRTHFADFEGSLFLAIAGYNYGEHRVDRALRKLDNPFGASPYWELVDRKLLPKETADYAPRFIAAAIAGEWGLPSAAKLRKAGY